MPYVNNVIYHLIFYQTILKSETKVHTYLLSYGFILHIYAVICISECVYVRVCMFYVKSDKAVFELMFFVD